MKLVIFAGGIGTRLWPLSRVNSPKQFDKIFNGASTLQLAFRRTAPVFGAKNIFIQTVAAYRDIIAEQLPEMPRENILVEPARRAGTGAAAGMSMGTSALASGPPTSGTASEADTASPVSAAGATLGCQIGASVAGSPVVAMSCGVVIEPSPERRSGRT